MPPTPTVKPDGTKIRELIRQWAEARRLDGRLKRRPGRGRQPEVAVFARKLGRPPDSILNVTSKQVDTSKPFIRQIARELGVRPSDISDMPPEENDDPDAWPQEVA